MRAPSQERKESHAAYTVRYTFKISDQIYVRGDTVDGDVARSWPTFRQLLNIDWLAPAVENVPSSEPSPAPRKRSR